MKLPTMPSVGERTAIGLACLAMAFAPVLVLGLLDVLGVLHIENGLLISLWLFLTLPVSLILLAVGIVADRRATRGQ